MRHMTNDEIRLDIAGLTERLRQIRIEKGLPPDPLPLPQIVDLPLAGALIERLKSFKPIAVKYAAILAEERLTWVDVSKLEHYARYARILGYSKGLFGGFYASGVRMMFNLMEHVNRAIDEGKTEDFSTRTAVWRAHIALSLIKSDGLSSDMWDEYGSRLSEGHRAAEAEMKRLITDDDAFQAACDEAMTQLPTKEEEDLYE